jgi:hypothetical protein
MANFDRISIRKKSQRGSGVSPTVSYVSSSAVVEVNEKTSFDEPVLYTQVSSSLQFTKSYGSDLNEK